MVEINPYVALSLNGFCTGLGVVIAQHLYNGLLQKRVNKAFKRIRQIEKGIKKIK